MISLNWRGKYEDIFKSYLPKNYKLMKTARRKLWWSFSSKSYIGNANWLANTIQSWLNNELILEFFHLYFTLNWSWIIEFIWNFVYEIWLFQYFIISIFNPFAYFEEYTCQRKQMDWKVIVVHHLNWVDKIRVKL